VFKSFFYIYYSINKDQVKFFFFKKKSFENNLYLIILFFFFYFISIYVIDKLNEKYKLIPYTEFYNDAINEQLEIKEDYPCWKAKE